MGALKLGPVADDRPVKLTVELSAETYRLLAAYAEAHARETGQTTELAKLVGPILYRFISTDRGFTRGRGKTSPSQP